MAHYENVRLSGLNYHLPAEIVTMRSQEEQLSDVFKKFHIPIGQVEALTGVREHRVWPLGFPVAQGALEACQLLLKQNAIDTKDIGLLIYGGVCKDDIEPATASIVAAGLGLSAQAMVFDVSNACLGVLNSIQIAANAIEQGQIKAAVICACESSRQGQEDLMRQAQQKNLSFADFIKIATVLTFGSGACALLLTHKNLSMPGHKLLGARCRNDVAKHDLNFWRHQQDASGHFHHAFHIDSVNMLKFGTKLASETYPEFLKDFAWEKAHKTICHQVSENNQNIIRTALSLSKESDYTTYETCGNMGAASLPSTCAIANEQDFFKQSDKVAWLGIGSGLNVMMMAWEWLYDEAN